MTHVLDLLNVRERLFCQEYIVDSDASRAAREAGYSGNPNVIAANASRLLKKPKIKEAIAYLLKPQLEEAQITVERVLRELEALTFRDIKEFVDDDGFLKTNLSEIPKHVAACIDGWEVKTYYKADEDGNEEKDYQEIKVRLVPKLPATELCMKYLKMLGPDLKIDKLQINNTFQQLVEQTIAPIHDPVNEALTRLEQGVTNARPQRKASSKEEAPRTRSKEAKGPTKINRLE